MSSPQSAGGQVMAIRQREEALKRYYSSPNICKHCNQIIKVRDHEKVSEVRKRKFCSRSCAASYNNSGRFNQPEGHCEKCGIEIVFVRRKNGGYSKRKYCDNCVKLVKAKKCGTTPILELTKGELFSKRSNWQSARSGIAKHARRVFNSSGLKKECKVCGYNKHIQVSHIKDVADFDDDTLIMEINDIDNLVALCPNHHWEFDNHIMSKIDLLKIYAVSSSG